MAMATQRLFFALQIEAPWPEELPGGRLLDPEHRHLTLAFLGNVEMPSLEGFLPPPFKVGPVGYFDKVLFLPHKDPNVAAWHVNWFEQNPLQHYPEELLRFLGKTPRSCLSHVTIARKPFNAKEWSSAFSPLPLKVTGLHLYESVGHLRYEPVWSYPLLSPFDEIDHTADIAFCVRGENFDQLYLNARAALAFLCPSLLEISSPPIAVTKVEEIVIALNALITEADIRWGSPFKAVSFSGNVREKQSILEWEMIVDV
ncbi:MAG: hypothetical protein JSR80_00585 [Verrucomicrobia bacterium]|nr:hypothetical protein [Verrucomicrobiota bacterium]